MERGKVSTWVRKLTSVFSVDGLNAIGRQTRLMQRERTITPYRLAVATVGALATKRIETIADIVRCFNGLFDTKTAYKPFHNQLSKREFATFMQRVAQESMAKLAAKVLNFRPGSRFREFSRIVIQDGSSFAVHEALREVFPGRFKTVKPAAVELHATFELLSESLIRVLLTPDTAPERDALPQPASLRGCLLLADRGYLAFEYLKELMLAGASFVLRAPVTIKPLVLDAITARGKRISGLAGTKFNEALLPKSGSTDLAVSWKLGGGRTLDCRLIATWNKAANQFQYLVTNLPRDTYSPSQVIAAYKLRWQVELLFKEWKSYANLHAFDTEKKPIVEGLIWASIAAATLKRFLAHATQHVARVETSTRKTAMCSSDVLTNIISALVSARPRDLTAAFEAAVRYLSTNALRAHPKRDRERGRLHLGLEPAHS